MLNPERGDASRSDQHFNPKQACHNSIIPYYSTKPYSLIITTPGAIPGVVDSTTCAPISV
ncbi:hypothetical protein [Candidatus Symbiopectobacterium sp.]|uniref:hypothetical protein n=1 Tax=Candidatus Symbiopectobacterium sp. TaxID=2816440 RepID=UPI0025C230E5|nr:hypothetical protein [Candidatus Symbiopectobacterium sp.]